MNKQLTFWIALSSICFTLLLSFQTVAYSEDNGPTITQTIFLPAIFRNHQQSSSPIPTATFISTVAPSTPTMTATPLPQNTITATPTATDAAASSTATPTPSATPTEVSGPTPTPTGTSIPYPPLTYTCAAVPATGASVFLEITITSDSPVPSASSFRFEPTTLSGPIDDILQPGPFQLVNMFSNDTSRTSPGALTQCDTQDACLVTYTLTDTKVTRDIGTTVDCHY